MTDKQEKDWIQNLTERRFFRYIITYIAVSWGLVQAIDWAVKRYDLNPSLVDASLLFFIALLPAIVLFTYNHGTPGKDHWRPIEKVAIPINLVLAIGLAGFIGYSSGSPEPLTETVELVDEDGKAMERVIYNRSLNNRAIIFPAEMGPGVTKEDWLYLTIPRLQEADLEQDPRLSILSPIGIAGSLSSYNKKIGDDLSFSVKRSIAEDRNVDFFIDIKCSKKDNQFIVKYSVFKTSDGKEVLAKQYTNEDLFSIVDGFSQDLNQYLYSRLGETDEIVELPDLPVRDLKSDNLNAVTKYVAGQYYSRIENNFPKGFEAMDEAIALDPEFMSAIYEKGSMMGAQGNVVESLKYLNEAAKYFGGQPERVTLSIKCQKYLYENDVDKARRVGEMWQKLYPQNTEVYNILNLIYQLRGEFDKRVALWQSGYDAGLKSNFILELGNLYSAKGEYDKAIKYFEEYQKLYPSKKGEVQELGRLYAKQGKLKESVNYFEDILIKDDQKVSNYLNFADALLRSGDFSGAYSGFQDALMIARTPQDSFSIYGNIANLFYSQGQAKNYLTADSVRIALFAKFAPPVAVESQYYNFVTIERYVNCGAKDLIRSKLDKISQNTQMGDLDWPCVINLNFGLGARSKELIEASIERCPDDLSNAIAPAQKLLIDGIKYIAYEDHEKVISNLNAYIEQSGQPRQELLYFLAPSNNELGNFDENIEELNTYLKGQKADASAYVELAKAYYGKGKTSKARESLKRALNIWKDADPQFIPANDAKKLNWN